MTAGGAPFLVATRSAGKLRELRPLFAEFGRGVIDLSEAGLPETAAEDEVEAFATFEENAAAKAAYFARLSGLATVADDSGVEVMALAGRPGVRSKRWSERPDLSGDALDAANNAMLKTALRGQPDRRARYVCVAAYCRGGVALARRGEVEGRILEQPRGIGGFGYDPYFWSFELEKSFGEASVSEKGRVSHRARAFFQLLVALEAEGL